jgi:hypothetical protein
LHNVLHPDYDRVFATDSAGKYVATTLDPGQWRVETQPLNPAYPTCWFSSTAPGHCARTASGATTVTLP